MHTDRYQGKYFSVLGDSISTLAGWNPPDHAVFYNWEHKRPSGVLGPEDTWWGKVIDALGGQLLMNESWSGSLVCKHPRCEIESYGCSDVRTGNLGKAVDEVVDGVKNGVDELTGNSGSSNNGGNNGTGK